MRKNKPIHLFNNDKRIDSSELKSAFTTILPLESVIENKDIILTKGIFFDFSKATFMSISVATQLCLIAEFFLKNDFDIYIALPTTTENERIRKCNQFLKYIEFDISMRCKHLKKNNHIFITERYFTKSTSINFNLFNESFEPENQFNQIGQKFSHIADRTKVLPITWIDANSDLRTLKRIKQKIDVLLGNNTKGLGKIDALALYNVIFTELLKNVKEHANSISNYAIFSIAIFSVQSLIKNDNTNFIDSNFNSWVLNNSFKSIVEIYFGDSGMGLVSDLLIQAHKKSLAHTHKVVGEGSTLKWSFSKWSTRKQNEEIRGTKGLYRINRINNKYNGLFLVHTKKLIGGYQKGGYTRAKWVKEKSSSSFYHPGTFTRIKLIPYKEIISFNFKSQKVNSDIKWIVQYFDFTKKDLDLFNFTIQNIIKEDLNILLILKVHYDGSLDSVNKSKIIDLLLSLSLITNPNGIVVYFTNDNIGPDTLMTIAEDANELLLEKVKKSKSDIINLDHASPNEENVYDPIIILEKGNRIFWLGGNQNVINILNEIYNRPNQINSLKQLSSFKKLSLNEQRNLLFHFQNDNALILILNDKRVFLNFTNIIDFFYSDLEKIVSSSSSTEPLITPKLKIVNSWINQEKLFVKDKILGYALALYLLFIKNNHIITPKTSILYDHNQQRNLSLEFARLSGINTRNIHNAFDDVDINVPRRIKLFKKGVDVIIITSIISSSETIRRLVKQVKRDYANPICILCLVNNRDYNIKRLTTWDIQTPIISIYTKNKNETQKKKLLLSKLIKKSNDLGSISKFISPHYQEEIIEKKEFELPSEIKDFFIREKILHYSHIGKNIGRHYTFYINKSSLFNNGSPFLDSIIKSIFVWKSENKIENFLLTYKNYEEINYFEKCIQKLKEIFPEPVMRVINFNQSYALSEENCIYLDFNSITGQAISEFSASLINTKNILVIILFSNLIDDMFTFYKNIFQIKIPHVKKEKNLRFIESQYELKTANIKIDFIQKFNLYYYTSANCPICEHERYLQLYNFHSTYMHNFVNDRKNRLEIMDRTNLSNIPHDFYFSNNDKDIYELSSILIMKMYEFKNLVDYSLLHTRYRVKLFDFLVNILCNIENESKNPESNLFAVLYLLSFEVYRLQIEPLVFQEFRFLISEMASYIATIEIKNLITNFNEITTNNKPLVIAVRYKFSAITVLRSSNKYKFCQEITKMVISSSYENRISDNTFQNILYHTTSLIKNRYNQSLAYFKRIQESFQMIDNNGIYDIIRASKKYAAYEHIKIENLKNIKQIESTKQQLEIVEFIFLLKTKIAEIFHSPHNVEEKLTLMDFRTLGFYNKKLWEDFSTHRKNSMHYESIIKYSKAIFSNWLIIKRLIDVDLATLFNKHQIILKSKIFQYFNSKLSYYNLNKETFHELSAAISKDPEVVIDRIEFYNNFIDTLYTLIDNREIYHEDLCNIHSIIAQFPSNAYNLLIDIYPKEGVFKNVIQNIDSIKNKNIIYPERELKNLLLHIKTNIKKKNTNLSEITLWISSTIKENKLHIFIENDHTKIQIDPNHKGGLEKFKNDLKIFNCYLISPYKEKNTNNYCIQLIFQLENH